MDFVAAVALRAAMTEPGEPPSRDALVCQLFYLLTARFEDAAAAAAEGQAANMKAEARVELANRLHSVAQEAMILSDAVIELLNPTSSPA